MEIKAKENASGKFKIIRSIFSSRKRIIAGFLGLTGLAGSIILAFGVLGLGAYHNKIAQGEYYKPTLLKISNPGFSFLGNLKNGLSNGFESASIRIEPKYFQQIEKLREKAFENGVITEAIKKEHFPAKITYRGKTHQVKIGLTGDMAMHFDKPLKWSLAIKTIGDDTVDGMGAFSLRLPSTGEYITDWLAAELMAERGIKGLKSNFVKLVVNGEPAGVFYMEEHFDKALAGQNQFEEGILFELGKDPVFYQLDQQKHNSTVRDQIVLVKQKWQDLNSGEISVNKFFDLEKMGRLIAISDLMGLQYPFQGGSMLYFFNPVTGLAEPIGADYCKLSDIRPFSQKLFIETPEPGNAEVNSSGWPDLIPLLHDDLEFIREYVEEAEMISRHKTIEQLLSRKGDQLHFLAKKAYSHWSENDLPMTVLYGKAKYIRYILFPDIKEVLAYLDQKAQSHLSVHLINNYELPVEVAYLSWKDSIFFYPEKGIVLSSGKVRTKEPVPRYDFQIPANLTWSDTLLPELEINYSIVGSQAGNKRALVFPWPLESGPEQFQNPANRPANYKTFDFVIENPEDDVLSIPAGAWSISRDLIIPRNKRLQLQAGAQIDLVNHAKIVSFSPVFSLGREDAPVLVNSSDATGEGLVIIRANKRSELIYTMFDRLSCPQELGWQLTGAVTFYESPVDFRYCNFSGNLRGDDFLNIVRSDFSMEHITFNNINADAFDCDFCYGSIKNASFINIGNDGIDVSGTELELSQVFMEFIGDKGLSAGENSKMIAEQVEIRNAEIGVTSKDRSTVFLSDSKLINTKIAITLFQKKSEFGPAFMSADRVSVQQSEIPYLVENNSRLVLNGSDFRVNQENVKDILYGVEYGKSSK